MDSILRGIKKILNPIVDALHMRNAASTVYQYLLDHAFMMWIILGALVGLIALLVVIIVLSSKARKRAKAIREAEENETADESPTEETVEEAAPVEEAVEEEPAPVEEAVEEEPAPVEEAVEEEPAPVEEVVEEPAPVKAEKKPRAKKTTVKEETALAAVEAPAPVEEKKQPKYRGKWVITKMITESDNEENREEMYFFELRASNGEKLMESQEYTSLAGAKKGIETHVNNIKNGNFKVSLTKKGTYIFKLMNAKGMLLCTGENYPSHARCESAIESTKRFGESAVIDENVQEIVIKVPADDDTATVAPATEGAIGKWIVSKASDDEGDEAYYFELFANNGEKLLSSEDYSSQVGALNGLETHKKNIEKGNFKVSLTKKGDYIFKLLNGNGQLLCLGEHYKTRRMCQSAVESVKRFALNSPVLTDIE